MWLKWQNSRRFSIVSNTTYRSLFLVTLVALVSLLGLGQYIHLKQAEAAATNIVGLQLQDDNCGGGSGTARYATDIGVWTPWAGDSDNYDPDCLKIYVGNTPTKDFDIRVGVQAQDINTPCGFLWLFKCGDGGGTIQYSPWASESVNSWSPWAGDKDMMDADQWRVILETRSRYGYTVSDFKLGYQLGDGGSNVYSDGGGCTYQVNPIYYTASSSAGSAWGPWATDNDFNCLRVNFVSTSTLNDPIAQFIGTSSAPAGNSINLPWDVEYINTTTGCTLVGRNAANTVVDDRSAYPITANGVNTTSTIAITEQTTYTLTCTGFKTGTTAVATKTIVPISQPAQLSFKMSPTSGISPGGISTATISATNASSCTLKGYDVSYNVVDAGYTFTPPPPSARLPYTGPTTREVIYLTAGTSWTVPQDWSNTSNTIEVVGGGGGGNTNASSAGSGGGGGGAYAKVTNITLTPGGTITYALGSGGAAKTAGGDTYFCNSTSNCASISGSAVVVGAKGGGGANALVAGAGGSAASSKPSGSSCTIGGSTMACDGGAGGVGISARTGGAGGGGAGGPYGVGGAGATVNNVASVGGSGGGGAFGGSVGTAPSNSNGGAGGASGGTWTLCAAENATCSFSGTKRVAYGANGSYNFGTYTTSVSCNNATFGDPINGTAKSCYYSSDLSATTMGAIASPGGAGGSGSNGTAGSSGSGGGGGANGSYNGGAGGAGSLWAATDTWNGTAYTATTPTAGPGGGGGGNNSSSNSKTAGAGGLYGGGGGGGGGLGVGGAGAQGIIIVTYTHPNEVHLTITSGSTWLVPDDWGTVNTIEVVGGGAGGNNRSNRGGGGGGAYSKITNTAAISPGRMVKYAIGAGGAAGVAGGDTYVCFSFDNCTSIAGSAVVVGAKGGSIGSGTAGGAGGSASGGYPTGASCTVGAANMRCSGGNGGNSGNSGSDDGPGGAGGGGAAGPNGAGKNGGSSSGHDEGSGGGANSGGSNGGNSDSTGGCWIGCGGPGGDPLGSGNGGSYGNDGKGGNGTFGGGGGGGDDDVSNPRGGTGGDGNDINGTIGSGGGGGGAGQNQYSSIGGNGGLYGGGGGGEGTLTGPTPGNGGSGAQGVIYITYTPSGTIVTDNTEAKTSDHVVNVTTRYVVSCTPYDGASTLYATSTVTLSGCMLDGVNIPDGGSSNFYAQSTPLAGHTCSEYGPLSRGCSSGQLTGNASYKYAMCTDQNDIVIKANNISGATSVRKGSSAAISWDGGNASSCTVTGTNGFNAANIDGTTDISATRSNMVNQKVIYTATCVYGNSTKSASVTVNILPTFINF